MVEIKTFREGFSDLEKMYIALRRVHEAEYVIRKYILDSSFGSIEDKSIFTGEEKVRFSKLSDALSMANDMLRDKISDQEKKCIRMNVVGFTEDVEKTEEPEPEENEFF